MDMTRYQKLAQLPTNFQDFAIAMFEKFERVALEKDRSLQPWEDFDLPFLMERLVEETQELIAAYSSCKVKCVIDESKDVALFAWFVYMNQLKELGCGICDDMPKRCDGCLTDL